MSGSKDLMQFGKISEKRRRQNGWILQLSQQIIYKCECEHEKHDRFKVKTVGK